MITNPKVTLDQWRVFHAIIEQGGYAQAASYLHRSQSAVSYAISKLQEQLGISLLKIEGRKAILTEAGEALLQRSGQLLANAGEIENFARHLSQGREAEIRFIVDAAFPNDLLMTALSRFAEQDQGTRVQLREVILSGASDALIHNEAELVIGVEMPNGFLADPLIEIEFIAVAHPDHPLHQLGREITSNDLSHHMHVVIRDSGQHVKMNAGWLSSEQRWTVSSFESALNAIEHGLGFGWLPSNRLTEAIGQGTLKPLKLEKGAVYFAHLFMGFGHPQNVGPATRELEKIVKDTVTKLN